MIGRLSLVVAVSLLGMGLTGGALAGENAAKDAKRLDTGTYISFEPLTATVRRANGRRGVLTVQGGLDVKDKALRTRAAQSGPLLRDAYNRALGLYGASMSPGAAPDVDQISLQLQHATDRVLHGPGARVLLGTIIVN